MELIITIILAYALGMFLLVGLGYLIFYIFNDEEFDLKEEYMRKLNEEQNE